MFFFVISICLSEKFFVKITLNSSSVGKSIPISKKLLNLELKSFNFTLNFLSGIKDDIIRYYYLEIPYLLLCKAIFHQSHF